MSDEINLQSGGEAAASVKAPEAPASAAPASGTAAAATGGAPVYGGASYSGERPYRREYDGREGDEPRPSFGYRGRGREGKSFYQKKKVCRFCTQKLRIDYKEPDSLRRFISERGKILPRRITGTCARHQREVAEAIKRARAIALLPFVSE